MNEYVLYHQLCVLADIADEYKDGKEVCSAIRSYVGKFAHRPYCLAVFGEFKRGKSSLINALLGAPVLPSDSIPLTAANTHVAYGTDQKFTIRYEDGGSEEKPLSELAQFMRSVKQEEEEESVCEIYVSYPSRICGNHIEIIDTPGLNDSDRMTYLTKKAAEKADAALFVMNPDSPMSMTEADTLRDLLCRENIKHILFVVNHLDRISGEKEKDRLLDHVKKKISAALLPQFRKQLADRPSSLHKAETLLAAPAVFGVSSRQALRGYSGNDAALVEQSRIRILETELTALLTRARTEDPAALVRDTAIMMDENLPSWKEAEEKLLIDNRDKQIREFNARDHFRKSSKRMLTDWMRAVDKNLEEKGFSSLYGFKNDAIWISPILKCFIKSLSSLNSQNADREMVLNALEEGRKSAENMFSSIETRFGEETVQAMQSVNEKYRKQRIAAGLPDFLPDSMLQEFADKPVPRLVWTRNPVPRPGESFDPDVMPAIRTIVRETIEAYGQSWILYINAWRLTLLRCNREDTGVKGEDDFPDETLFTPDNKVIFLNYSFRRHLKKIREIASGFA